MEHRQKIPFAFRRAAEAAAEVESAVPAEAETVVEPVVEEKQNEKSTNVLVFIFRGPIWLTFFD